MADQLRRLVAAAYSATAHVSPKVSAVALYREAAAIAETRLPGTLGVAVAGVLVTEADLAAAAGMTRGCLGASRTTMALALAVMELAVEDAPPAPTT